MEFSELKDILVKNGFTTTDDIVFTRSDKTIVQSMVINGQKVDKTADVKLVITYLGNGSINDDVTQGVNFTVIQNEDKKDLGDFWLVDSSDVKLYFKLDV